MSYANIKLFQPVKTEDYLEAAIKTAEYIQKNEIKAARGKYWTLSGSGEKEQDEVESAFLSNRSLYAGAAGIGYFFIQLYEVTKDQKWLEEAKEAAEYLIDSYDKSVSNKPGLHAGAAGEGLFLYLLYDKVADERYTKQALVIAEDIYASAKKDEQGLHWESLFDVMGDGGAILYWLKVAERTKEDKYIRYAKEALDSILKLSKEFDEESIYWNLLDPHDFFDELPAGGIVPNFAHGTAGIVYLLTKYYEATKEKDYLNKAIKGFQFLKKIAVKKDDSVIVPYLYFGDREETNDIFYLGFCHGPVGDAITASELYKVTGEKEYLDFYIGLTNALIEAGVPEKRSTGYWNDCICCGSAGVLLHFTKAAERDEKYLEYAKKTAEKSINDAYKDRDGYRWYNPWTRVKPWDVQSHLGLFVGAAGSASALLFLYAKETNKTITPIYEYQA